MAKVATFCCIYQPVRINCCCWCCFCFVVVFENGKSGEILLHISACQNKFLNTFHKRVQLLGSDWNFQTEEFRDVMVLEMWCTVWSLQIQPTYRICNSFCWSFCSFYSVAENFAAKYSAADIPDVSLSCIMVLVSVLVFYAGCCTLFHFEPK